MKLIDNTFFYSIQLLCNWHKLHLLKQMFSNINNYIIFINYFIDITD